MARLGALLRLEVKSDGSEHYDNVLFLESDSLEVSESTDSILRNEIWKYFELKEELIGTSDAIFGRSI